ncbi:hypothetical protein AALO_G00204060 [Alosa alosa]|uniref:EGF-like domain-containing protein n=1 Tax=Alosa alosa TaxID=278164 RepID=A0AAV6G876_9TELE|nr:hypothetical protein AALO_G00204060 [Alosa alosa]
MDVKQKQKILEQILASPNVCGSRCCHGWTVAPKKGQCTKPRCYPRCHNRAICRKPNACECRAGFHGYRCEHATGVTSDPPVAALSWAHQVAPTSPSPLTSTTPAMPTATSPATTGAATVTPSPSGQTTQSGLAEGSPTSASAEREENALRWKTPLALEAQSVLLKKTLSSVVKGRKMSSLLMKHIEAERNKLLCSTLDTHTPTSSTKTFHTERGQYTLIMSYEPAPDFAAQQQVGNITVITGYRQKQ